MAGKETLSSVRARYAKEVMVWAREAGVETARIEAAFAAVPRENYLTPPPWRIFAPGGWMDDETSDPEKLYADVLVVLDRRQGINNGQPSLHAGWMAAVDPRPGESVVQIGIGAGYYTAILAELVGEGGRVEAYEIESHLAEIARTNLAPLRQVRVHAVSGISADLPDADVVYVSAGAAAPDASWVRCLTGSGRLIFPWQPDPGHGQTMLVERVGEGFRAKFLMNVAFVGCIGAGLKESRATGIPSRAIAETRSLWLHAVRPPDATATAIYRDLWFSAEEV